MEAEPHRRSSSSQAESAVAPHRVRVPVNLHEWRSITFLHWAYAPDVLAGLLPHGLVPDTADGRAWVSVTPFGMRVRPPGSPVVPPGWAFPETNVRTYVLGPDGTPGLWFLHMEVTARWFVASLRALGLPYVHRHMAIEQQAGSIAYRSTATAGTAGGHDIVVRPGPSLEPASGDALARFLTARWRAYHRRGILLATPVEHPAWQLHRAEVSRCEVDGLFRAAGLPLPAAPPLVHWSPGVAVRVGLPRRAR